MDPLTILNAFDRAPEDEVLEAFTDWILELSLGRAQYEDDGEHLVEEASTRWSTKPVRHVVALALAAADMRMDMAMSESYGEPAADATTHKRKVELIDSLVVRELEQL